MSDVIDRSSCPGTRHGTVAAYSCNGCRCPDAKRAKARYIKRRKAGVLPPAHIDATGAIRRLRALQAIGYSLADLAAKLGYISESSFGRLFQLPGITRERHQRIADLYDELCMIPGPSRRAVLTARRRGWPAPLAWDDIDRDAAPVDVPADDQIDPVAVSRTIAGEPPTNLREAELLTAVAELIRRGGSTKEIAMRLGVEHAQAYRYRCRVLDRQNRQRSTRTTSHPT